MVASGGSRGCKLCEVYCCNDAHAVPTLQSMSVRFTFPLPQLGSHVHAFRSPQTTAESLYRGCNLTAQTRPTSF